ncbi:MAG: hypothetical protein ACE5NA_00205 [Nitrospiraceae bacterium]
MRIRTDAHAPAEQNSNTYSPQAPAFEDAFDVRDAIASGTIRFTKRHRIPVGLDAPAFRAAWREWVRYKGGRYLPVYRTIDLVRLALRFDADEATKQIHHALERLNRFCVTENTPLGPSRGGPAIGVDDEQFVIGPHRLTRGCASQNVGEISSESFTVRSPQDLERWIWRLEGFIPRTRQGSTLAHLDESHPARRQAAEREYERRIRLAFRIAGRLGYRIDKDLRRVIRR